MLVLLFLLLFFSKPPRLLKKVRILFCFLLVKISMMKTFSKKMKCSEETANAKKTSLFFSFGVSNSSWREEVQLIRLGQIPNSFRKSEMGGSSTREVLKWT